MAKLTLLRCGTCGKRYTNPARHVCRTRLDRKRPPGKTRVKPRVTFTCGTCGKATTNPLTHTCRIRTDFRRRKANQARREKAASRRRRNAARRRATTRQTTTTRKTTARSTPRPSAPSLGGSSTWSADGANHDYRACFQSSHDTRGRVRHECPRFPCRVYAEGYANGHDTGEQIGHAAGYSAGYSAGYAEAANTTQES
jgi:hypothetical protein